MIAPDFRLCAVRVGGDSSEKHPGGGIAVVRQGEPNANDLVKERMAVQGLYDWTRSHITSNAWPADSKNEREVRKHYGKGEELFIFKKSTTGCATTVDGIVRATFDSESLPSDATMVAHR